MTLSLRLWLLVTAAIAALALVLATSLILNPNFPHLNL